MPRTPIALVVLALFVATDLMAQYPGQYPGGYPPGGYPPGTYPGGQYPGGIGGIPWPRRGKKKKAGKEAEEANLKQIKGMLRQLNAKSIVVTADDSRNIEFKRSDRTEFLDKGKTIKADLLRPGDHILVEASEDEEGYFSAVRVNLEKEGTMEDRQKASVPVQVTAKELPASSDGASGGRGNDDPDRPVLRRAPATAAQEKAEAPAPPERPDRAPASAAPPSPAPAANEKIDKPSPPEKADLPVVESNVPIDESDPGPPTLRRGGPAKRRHQPVKTAANTTAPAAAEPPASPTRAPVPPDNAGYKTDPRIEKAREAAARFTESLPAYVCQEQIARYQSTTQKVSWQALDIVSAEVVYDNHKEVYRNLAINGKPVNKRMDELSGSWSTGEFGTVLLDLFHPATAADFRYRRQVRSAGREAWLFDFEVDRENSHWHVEVGSQSILPAYRGSVWIDKETSQALRIEMQAVNLPKEFPLDTIESATDYQYIRISDRNFLLPVHAEVLSCQRGTSNCSRNAIDFRNYHKYAGESVITFENK